MEPILIANSYKAPSEPNIANNQAPHPSSPSPQREPFLTSQNSSQTLNLGHVAHQQDVNGLNSSSENKTQDSFNSPNHRNSSKGEKYIFCRCFVIRMTKKKWTIMMICLALLVAIIVSIAIAVPLAMKSQNNVQNGRNNNIIITSKNNNNVSYIPQFLYVGDTNGTLIEITVASDSVSQLVKAHETQFCYDECIVIDRNKKKLYTTSTDGTLKSWPMGVSNPTPSVTFTRNVSPKVEYNAIHLAANDQLWAATSENGIYRFNAETGAFINAYADIATINGTYSIKASQKTNTLYSASPINGIVLWDTNTYLMRNNVVLPATTRAPSSSAYVVTLINDETRLLAGMWNNTSIALFDLGPNGELQTSNIYPSRYSIGTLNHDSLTNRVFAGGPVNGEITVLDLNTGTFQDTLKAHTFGIASIALSGRFMFSCGIDNKVIQWNLDTLQKMKEWNTKIGNTSGRCRTLAVY